MAQTPSNMVPLGISAPDFSLPDVISGKKYNLFEQANAKAVLIMFICNHCPYVKHLIGGLVHLADDYIGKGIEIVAISSNDIVKYPDDSPEKMRELALQKSFSFPYLFDETQEVAKSYDAACTPDFYVFDRELKLVYRGQFDDSRPSNNVPVTGKDIRTVFDLILQGKEVGTDQRPSIGCNIKWK
jgi:peroxiredoxin